MKGLKPKRKKETIVNQKKNKDNNELNDKGIEFMKDLQCFIECADRIIIEKYKLFILQKFLY